MPPTVTDPASCELTLNDLDRVSAGATNGDNPFVKAVLDAYNATVLFGGMGGTKFPAGPSGGSGGGSGSGGECHTNHNGVQY